MRSVVRLAILLCVTPAFVSAQKPPLLPEKDVAALAQELSGEIAKRNLEGVTRFHRQRGSQGFHSAAELVAETRARLRLERCRDPGVSGGREDLLRHAAIASAVGCGICGTLADSSGHRCVR